MEAGLKLSKNEEEAEANATEYRKLIGCLRICKSVYALAKSSSHEAVKHLLRYVRGTIEYGIQYKKGGRKVLKSYSDSSYNIDIDDGKSTTGTVFYFCDAPIAWNTQKQSTVALSSCEAEFMAAALAACQALWLQGLLEDLTSWKQ
ncbi:secreted RxLR effector protein 161-like [Bidens hawaiensis]|uniref:secreted RxLR effector protein 161-like n=1 Tax=Bidens hawaiensis TaxID=980011 RepID=UPI00404A7841